MRRRMDVMLHGQKVRQGSRTLDKSCGRRVHRYAVEAQPHRTIRPDDRSRRNNRSNTATATATVAVTATAVTATATAGATAASATEEKQEHSDQEVK